MSSRVRMVMQFPDGEVRVGGWVKQYVGNSYRPFFLQAKAPSRRSFGPERWKQLAGMVKWLQNNGVWYGNGRMLIWREDRGDKDTQFKRALKEGRRAQEHNRLREQQVPEGAPAPRRAVRARPLPIGPIAGLADNMVDRNWFQRAWQAQNAAIQQAAEPQQGQVVFGNENMWNVAGGPAVEPVPMPEPAPVWAGFAADPLGGAR